MDILLYGDLSIKIKIQKIEYMDNLERIPWKNLQNLNVSRETFYLFYIV